MRLLRFTLRALRFGGLQTCRSSRSERGRVPRDDAEGLIAAAAVFAVQDPCSCPMAACNKPDLIGYSKAFSEDCSMSLLPKFGLALTAFAALMSPVNAQDYPTKSVRMIVPFAAGGPAD